MVRAYRWLLPHPLLTLTLAVVWTLLQNDVSAGMVVFGIILGIIIPRITAIWWPDTPKGFRLGKMISYSAIVLWDIIVANLQVAWIVLTVPNAKLKPAWIAIPRRSGRDQVAVRAPPAGDILMTSATAFLDIALGIAFLALIAGQILSMVRLVVGPTSGDRILALDTMVINALGLVVVLGIHQGVRVYFEVSLLIAMLGFVSTVALARFILRGDIIE